jgi:hypothetical protein
MTENYLDAYRSAGANLLIWFESNKPEEVPPSNLEEYIREYTKRHLEVDKLLTQAFIHKELTEPEYAERCQSLDAIMADFNERIKKRRGGPATIEDIIKTLLERGGGGGGFFIMGGGGPPR